MISKKTTLIIVLFLLGKVSFAQQTILSDSNLPIMIISTDIDPNTNSPYEIPDEPKIFAEISIEVL